MDDARARRSADLGRRGASRFEFAPPRRFVLPAVLLLLSERPGYGYSLEKDLARLPLRQDRPAHGLPGARRPRDATGWSRRRRGPDAGAGPPGLRDHAPRRAGAAGVDERDQGGAGLPRPASCAATRPPARSTRCWPRSRAAGRRRCGSGWSPVSATSAAPRHLSPVDADWRYVDARGGTGPPATATADGRRRGRTAAPTGLACVDGVHRFRLVPDRSVVLIEVRSTRRADQLRCRRRRRARSRPTSPAATIRPGSRPPPTWRSRSTGCGRATASTTPSCSAASTPGAIPVVTLDLHDCLAVGPGSRYRLAGELAFHGVTRQRRGDGRADRRGRRRRLVVTGEQVFDIRDFAVPSPTVLMLRIYPDVRVHLHVEAELEEA